MLLDSLFGTQTPLFKPCWSLPIQSFQGSAQPWTLPAKLVTKMAKHPSPAKKLRSIKRLLTFCLQKMKLRTPSLTVCKVEETNYPASKPKISIPARLSNLSIQFVQRTSIPSHPVKIKPPIIMYIIGMSVRRSSSRRSGGERVPPSPLGGYLYF